jgi:hypothetical protein
MTKVDTRILMNFVRDVAGDSKHGEPEVEDQGYIQNWEADGGLKAIDQLHKYIDGARDLLLELEQ